MRPLTLLGGADFSIPKWAGFVRRALFGGLSVF